MAKHRTPDESPAVGPPPWWELMFWDKLDHFGPRASGGRAKHEAHQESLEEPTP